MSAAPASKDITFTVEMSLDMKALKCFHDMCISSIKLDFAGKWVTLFAGGTVVVDAKEDCAANTVGPKNIGEVVGDPRAVIGRARTSSIFGGIVDNIVDFSGKIPYSFNGARLACADARMRPFLMRVIFPSSVSCFFISPRPELTDRQKLEVAWNRGVDVRKQCVYAVISPEGTVYRCPEESR